jgi:type IV pilus assembly protein PilW
MILRSKQLGLSLVELMVSVAAGMIVVMGVTSVYISTIVSSSDTLKQSRLNQELSTIVSVMSNDIRRAGIWQGTGTIRYTSPQNNPFAVADNTALTVVDQPSNTTIDPFGGAWPGTSSGDCILYAYDNPNAGTLGTLDNSDIYGFRLNGNVIQIRSQGDASGTDNDLCTTGTWTDMSDAQAIAITNLSFNLVNSACINTAEPNEEDDNGNGTVNEDAEKDCYTVHPSSGDITTETRQVDITITGQVINDVLLKSTLEQSIRVRNDLVTETP